MSICKDCIHYEICDEYVAPNESFPEVEGGCRCFKDKADVVEVVRCKDCRRWTPSKRYGRDLDDVKRYYGDCAVTHRSEREDHYCSYGKRREE